MSSSVAKSSEKADYYTILGLSDVTQLSPDIVRTAYRRALLLHHPDRLLAQTAVQGPREVPKHRFTVDQIAEAYATLSDPGLKSSYDEGLLRNKARLVAIGRSGNRTGLEKFDLEDLEYDDSSQKWSRKCRCGGLYSVTEQELEEVASEGEVFAGCHGCSLCIRITFDIASEGDDMSR